MEFCRLIKFFILYIFFGGCTYDKEIAFIFQGKIIGSDEIFDSLILVTQEASGDSVLVVTKGNSFIKDNSFTLLERDSKLICIFSDCSTEILLNLGTTNSNKCPSMYPFWGEWITVLDVKTIDLNTSSYKIYKLSNENENSPSTSSGVYWLKDFGIIFISLLECRYLELVDAKDKSVPWKSILSEMKRDKKFSELWEIPPSPPPPSLDDDT